MMAVLGGTALAVSRDFLYPHGRGVPDQLLPPQDDVSSPEIFLKTPIVFYDEQYYSIYVSFEIVCRCQQYKYAFRTLTRELVTFRRVTDKRSALSKRYLPLRRGALRSETFREGHVIYGSCPGEMPEECLAKRIQRKFGLPRRR